MNIKEKKLEYNLMVEEYQSCAAYLDNIEIPMEQKEKAIPIFKNLAREIEGELKWFDKNGIKYTDEEIMEGFKL